MTTVRKGDVDGEARGKDASGLSRSQSLFSEALGSVTIYSLPALIVGIPVAFMWGVGTKLWQRAWRLGRRIA
jgi:hypothetical protein